MILHMVTVGKCGCRYETQCQAVGPGLVRILRADVHRCRKHRRVRDRLYFHPKRVAS